MESAFGVDHGEVSKAMGPVKTQSLLFASKGGGRSAQYARARLSLAGQQGSAAESKKVLNSTTRTPFGTRSQNRRGIF